MKRKKLLFVLAFVLPLTGAFASKVLAKKGPAAYTPISGVCTLRPEPLACTQAGTAICTVSGQTYYSDASCLNVILYHP